MRNFLAVLSIVFSVGALADSRVLIPSFYNGPGSFGSQWATGVVVNNHRTAPLSSPGVTFSILCERPERCSSSEVPASGYAKIEGPSAPNGLLLYLPDASAVSFAARFAAAPRNIGGGGTELPIVPESEFTTSSLRFPAVPIWTVPRPIRTTLRIYGLDSSAGAAVDVQLTNWQTPDATPDFVTRLPLTIPPGTSATPLFPAYAQVVLQDEFGLTGGNGGAWNVTVTPVASSAGKIWAFLTITDNTTQEVTVQSPQ